MLSHRTASILYKVLPEQEVSVQAFRHYGGRLSPTASIPEAFYMMEKTMKTTFSRRQFFGLASLSAAGLVLQIPRNDAGGPIIVEEDGTLMQALERSGRAVIALWPLEGQKYPYIAAFDGEAILLHGSPRAFAIAHNGFHIDEPLAERPVMRGDEIAVTIVHC